MDSQKILILTSKIDSFPVLPTVVGRVMEITADPDSAPKDLINVISPDQSLTTTILKMANSAYFGLTREISSLQQALTILGFTEIRNLVLAKAVFNSFKNLKKGSKFDIRKFWEHSFICGIAAKIIATELKLPGNEFFVAGLIHDIGKLVIFMAMPDDFFKIIEASEPLIFNTYKAEKDILGVTHDEIGIALVKKWMFPENLITAVGFHHRPAEAAKQSLFPFVVYVADQLAHLNEFENSEDKEPLLKEKDIYPEIIKLSQSQNIEWNESDLKRFQDELAKKKEEEAGALSLFL